MDSIKERLLYKKPDFLCKELSGRDLEYLNMNDSEFILAYKSDIESEIKSHGLLLRFADLNDIYSIRDFISLIYREDLKDEVSPYDIYRFIEYGYGLIVEDKEKAIQGCLFEVGYQTEDMVSYSVRLGVSGMQKGKNLGKLMTTYTCLLGMERGALVKKGLIDFDNHANLYIQLNHNGWLIEKFYPVLQGLGSCFVACQPLSKDGMLLNKIDNKKLIEFVKKGKNGKDYLLVDSLDMAQLTDIYKDGEYKLIALIKAGEVAEGLQFFLMSLKDLNYKKINVKLTYEYL